MEPRIDYLKNAYGAYEAMLGLEKYIHKSGLDEILVDLVTLRASHLTGCAYCIDIHWKDLRALGENEQRLYGLDAWEESPYYSDRERGRWHGPRPSLVYAKGTLPTRCTKKSGRCSRRKNSPISRWL